MEKQLDLNIYKGSHSGRRPNSGRKRIQSKGVNHKRRERITQHIPCHINFKYRTEVILEHFILAMKKSQKHGFRIIHFSMQTNHIHLIAEAHNNKILEKGMRSLTNSFVKRLNSLKKMKGSIQIERYHLHLLKKPTEVDSFSTQVQSFFLDNGKS